MFDGISKQDYIDRNLTGKLIVIDEISLHLGFKFRKLKDILIYLIRVHKIGFINTIIIFYMLNKRYSEKTIKLPKIGGCLFGQILWKV